MGDELILKLNIHYGGCMKKEDENYIYRGEVGCKGVLWKMSELRWERFEAFIQPERFNTPISLVWYKDAREEMNDIKNVFENLNEDMFHLCAAGKVTGELDIYIEHDCSEHLLGTVHYLTSSKREDVMHGEEDNVDGYEGEKEGGYDESDDSGNDDDHHLSDREDDNMVADDERTREDGEGEGERSEDEYPAEEDHLNAANQTVDDDGDEVVVDAGDGASDERFKVVFEEGAKTITDFKAAYSTKTKEKVKEAREAEESDQEVIVRDEEYPDTPIESEEEWEQWMNKKRPKKESAVSWRFGQGVVPVVVSEVQLWLRI